MRHDAAQAARAVQLAGDRQQLFGIARLDARAVAVAIDLDQRGNDLALGLRAPGDGARGLKAVDHHGQVRPWRRRASTRSSLAGDTPTA